MRRLDNSDGPQWFSVVVYGKSGSGKTSLAVTAPKPLVLLSERQGEIHLRQSAARLGVPMPATIAVESVDDLRSILRALRGPKDQPLRIFEGHGADRELTLELDWPETVVLDTVTDFCRLVVEEIREQSPPKQGRDGLPVDSERYWNVLGDRCTNLILGFRDAPVHKLFLCAEDDRETGEGDDKKRVLQPNLPMRKLAATLSGAGNMTAYAYRRETREKDQVKVVYGVMTSGPEFILLKPCRPLRNVEVPDFGYWVRVVRGSLEGAPPAAPAPSGESLAQPVAEADRPIQADPAAASSGPANVSPEAEAPAAEAKHARARKKRGGR